MNQLFQQLTQTQITTSQGRQNRFTQSQNQPSNILQSILNSKNPQAMLQNLILNNPQMSNLVQTVQQSGLTPKQYFFQYAQQNGINPEQFLNTLKNLGGS